MARVIAVMGGSKLTQDGSNDSDGPVSPANNTVAAASSMNTISNLRCIRHQIYLSWEVYAMTIIILFSSKYG